MLGGSLATIDLVIIAAYFALVLYIGLRVAARTSTGEELFLAGRNLRWPLIGGSLFASNISSTTLIGLAGAAYMTGIAVSNYEWMAGVVLAFMAVFFIPVYLRTRLTTVPEYLELRFSRPARLYFSAVTILLTLFVDTAGGIYAGAVVLRTFFPDLPLTETCVGLAVFAGLYTAAGGLRAVVLTDVLQAAILIVGATALTVIVFGHYDYSWSTAKAAIPEGHLSLIRPLDDDALPWLGTLIGVPILGFWYWSCNQYITQRILGAASLRDAQWGANLGGALKLLPLFIMVIPGAMAIGIFPDLENGDRVFPTMVAELLPVGLTGIVLAGLTAAIMSSIDSTLNSSSTLVIHDFVEKAGGTRLSPERLGLYGRITTVVLMAIAAIWAPNIANFQGLFSYLQQAFSILVPPVVAVFLLGMFTRSGGGRTAMITLIIGHAAGIALFVAGQYGLWTLHFTINVGIMTALSAILFLVLARTEPRAGEEALDRLTWRKGGKGETEADLPFLRRPTVQAMGVLLATAVIVVAFW